MPIKIGGQDVEDIHVNGHDLQAVWVRGEKVWPLVIEGWEGISTYDEVMRGTFTGSADITSNAALATGQGSTQGLRCDGFVEMYALPGDHDPALESGREASFYFRPVDFNSGDQFHFILAPQSSASSPPDESYRFEFHMDGGSRLTHVNGGRDVLDTENNTSWSSQVYKCTFRADNGGVEFTVAGETLSTSNTDYVDNVMGFGFRASGGGSVDYDWLSY